MSSDISINSGTHNQASEVPDEQPTSATQENGPDLEALREAAGSLSGISLAVNRSAAFVIYRLSWHTKAE